MLYDAWMPDDGYEMAYDRMPDAYDPYMEARYYDYYDPHYYRDFRYQRFFPRHHRHRRYMRRHWNW